MSRRILDQAGGAANGDTIDLGGVAHGSWDRIHVLFPDTGNQEANDTLGFVWRVEETGGGFFDHEYRIVVVDDETVVAWSRISEDDLDFCWSALEFDPEHATAKVGVDSDGERYLVTPTQELVDSPADACYGDFET